MKYIVIITSLLVFAWVNYQLGFRKGFSDGFKKGVNKVVNEWRAWLDKVEEE